VGAAARLNDRQRRRDRLRGDRRVAVGPIRPEHMSRPSLEHTVAELRVSGCLKPCRAPVLGGLVPDLATAGQAKWPAAASPGKLWRISASSRPGTGGGVVGLAAWNLSRRISMWSGPNIVGDKQIGKQPVQPRHRTYALRVASGASMDWSPRVSGVWLCEGDHDRPIRRLLAWLLRLSRLEYPSGHCT
jgi:hypothetical protein